MCVCVSVCVCLSLQSEELQQVKSFLDMNRDLQAKLLPQWQRLATVQAQHGQQINTLTNRVGQLEKLTVLPDGKRRIVLKKAEMHCNLVCVYIYIYFFF